MHYIVVGLEIKMHDSRGHI